MALTDLNPDDGRSWQLLAEIVLARGEPGRALEILRPNELRQPVHWDTFLTEAEALRALGRPDRARTALQRLTRRWPAEASGHRALGLLDLELGRNEEARASFERLLALDPNDREIAALIEGPNS